MSEISDEIAPDEVLYRRIPPAWQAKEGLPPSPEAFRPRSSDTDGLSFRRAKFVSLEEASHPLTFNRERSDQVKAFQASELIGIGLELRIDPLDPSHVLASNLNWGNARDEDSERMITRMATSIGELKKPPFPKADSN